MSKSQPNFPISGIRIVSTGIHLPEKVLTNQELEAMVETSDDWIISRTGIKERRIANNGTATSDLGAKAALQAIKNAKIKASDIDLILVATITPDATFPSTACFIQDKIKAHNAAALDIQAACSGFLYGLVLSYGFTLSGQYRNILLIGAERLSSIIDWTDRNTCVLFGDGAGAAIIQPNYQSKGLLASNLGAKGSHHKLLYLDNGLREANFQNREATLPRGFLRMTGPEVFKHAVNAMYHSCLKTLKDADCTVEDLRCVISHQANIRIIDALRQRLKVPEEKCFINVERYGNISAACIPIALHEAKDEYLLQPGDKILLVAFGGGLTWGSCLVQL